MNAGARDGTVAFAVVHHANQYLVTDGYDNRQGLSEIADGFTAVLRLHERCGVPAGLHLSGTLVEALAWQRPDFLDRVKGLVRDGLVAIVGGTYSENVMTLFSPDFNRRQLDEALRVYERLLGCDPTEIKGFWVPERVWETSALAPLLTRRTLLNGGYRYVLLDDRLLFYTDGSGSGSRSSFDAAGPYGAADAQAVDPRALPETSRHYRIADTDGLVVVPMSAHIRYSVPPRSRAHLDRIEEMVSSIEEPAGRLLVYADDLEKAAGVAGWEPAREQYESFVEWLAEHERLTPVLLERWLDEHPAQEERTLEAGTFFELARGWGAGENYRGWADSPAWSPYREHFSAAQRCVEAAGERPHDGRLLGLAWKHLLASSHETAWHEPGENGGNPYPAPWAQALASHARACLPIAAAAEWFARGERSPLAEVRDVDADGEEEVVLATEELFAVIAPEHGGRLVYLFRLLPGGGVLLVGNPTDHWNFQEELNRYMDVPSNHPGAFADVGFEHDRYKVAEIRASRESAFVRLVNIQTGSALEESTKSFLAGWAPTLAVCYDLTGVEELATEACLSPDYDRLLRQGRGSLRPVAGETWRGVRSADALVWLGIAAEEGTDFGDAGRPEAGHGINVRVQSGAGHFHLVLGCGEPADAMIRELTALLQARHAAERSLVFASTEGKGSRWR